MFGTARDHPGPTGDYTAKIQWERERTITRHPASHIGNPAGERGWGQNGRICFGGKADTTPEQVKRDGKSDARRIRAIHERRIVRYKALK